eukprot:970234-Pyramimonas_sp.AAC.1
MEGLRQEEDIPDAKRQSKVSSLYACKSVWRSKNRKHGLGAVSDPAGSPLFEADETCQELARYWGQVHKETAVSRDAL